MPEREIVVELDELRMEVQCTNCHAVILLDFSPESRAQQIQSKICASCAKEHIPLDAANAFKRFVDKVRESHATVKFRIKES